MNDPKAPDPGKEGALMQPCRLRAAGGRSSALPLHPLAHCSRPLHCFSQRPRQRACAAARHPCRAPSPAARASRSTPAPVRWLGTLSRIRTPHHRAPRPFEFVLCACRGRVGGSTPAPSPLRRLVAHPRVCSWRSIASLRAVLLLRAGLARIACIVLVPPLP